VPIRTLVGPNVAALLKQAQLVIGADAVILHVRRIRTADGSLFEVAAADPASAARSDVVARSTPTAALEMIVPAQPAKGPLIVALVGPTGSGKTTTVAKLATHPRVFGNRRVGLLCLDTFRIGGIDQLKTYAEIARLPFEVAYSPEDLARARGKFADCDVILVDTPGRSPRQRNDRESAGGLLEALAPQEVHLVIPAGTAPRLARMMVREVRTPRVTHLLITKCDEAPDENGIFDLGIDQALPIRWTTDGQDVPFDLASADEAMQASRVSRQSDHGGYREAVA
jgi:flagellar biosynthesis protein FlhF